MGKHGTTKDRIVDLILHGTDNLSEISAKLDLAPSTVSKHLQDLEDSGAIRQREDEHIKKWKHYLVNKGSEAEYAGQRQERSGSGFVVGGYRFVAIIVAIAVGALFVY